MENTLDEPLIVGDPVRAVKIEAPGPDAPAPAQATQFSHPLILCIWLFTVCADEEAAAKMNSAIARTDKLLVVFFTITTFTPGGFCVPSQACRDEVGDYRRIYSGTTLFHRPAIKVEITD